MGKSSRNILQNIVFCVAQKEVSEKMTETINLRAEWHNLPFQIWHNLPFQIFINPYQSIINYQI